MEHIAGIDFGAKASGNTVIAFLVENKVQFDQVKKGTDTDKWLITRINEYKFKSIYLDAPLSLPAAYYGLGNNYHYRACDIETKAMSPMFLGGLTARAIALKNGLNHIAFLETYPAHFQRTLLKSTFYKKNIPLFIEDLNKMYNLTFHVAPINWHQIDASLALASGIRHRQNKHTSIGHPEEGIIII